MEIILIMRNQIGLMTKLLFILLFFTLGCEIPIGMKIIDFYNAKTSKNRQNIQVVFDKLNNLSEADKILISFDYSESSKLELEPIAIALLQHMFSKKVKVYIITLWPDGEILANDVLDIINSLKLFNPKENKDYVNLGYKPGGPIVIRAFAFDNIQSLYTNSILDLEIMEDVIGLNDFDLVFNLSAGTPGFAEWVQFGCDVNNIPLLTASTSIMNSDIRPYLYSGQVKGMLSGISDAIGYANLVQELLDNTETH